MLDGLGVELALGVAGTQLFVPVFTEEPVARRARVSLGETFGARDVLGAVLGADTVGMRTMFVPLELRPREDEPRLTLEEPREEEDPMEIPLEEVEGDELTRGAELLGLEELMREPTEELLPLELLPLELLPLELLPLELLPLALLLPLELLCEALAPLEPRCASTGTSRTKRVVVRMRESLRRWRIAVPFGAVRRRDGCLKQRRLRGDGSYRANRMPKRALSSRDLRNSASLIRCF